MPFVKVKPAEGARIRQPNRNSRVMPPEGDMVNTDDTFYSRLINSGDLVVVEEEKPAEEQAREERPAPEPRKKSRE
jgi:hypothetical protein